jgi:predicted phage terminase large subunit-like protein
LHALTLCLSCYYVTPRVTPFAQTHPRVTDAATGSPHWRILTGTPSWQGLDRAACEQLLNTIGLRAFRVECQHEREILEEALFRREWFRVVEDWPRHARRVRAWDLAATSPTPTTDSDYSVGLLMAEQNGQYWIVDMQRIRTSPQGVEALIAQTARRDGKTEIVLEQEPGSSGQYVLDHYRRTVLKGYAVRGIRSTGSKVERAKPLSSATEAGNVFLVHGAWNAAFLAEAEDFPFGTHDDYVDATSLALNALMTRKPAPLVLPFGIGRRSNWIGR